MRNPDYQPPLAPPPPKLPPRLLELEELLELDDQPPDELELLDHEPLELDDQLPLELE